MEDTTAARTYPLDRVLAAVRQSDALVVIVAWRYGYVPVGAANAPLPPGALPDQTSITEFEYLAALDKDIPVLPFLLDESAPWPPRYVDGFADPTVSIATVTTFRSRLMQDHVGGYGTVQVIDTQSLGGQLARSYVAELLDSLGIG